MSARIRRVLGALTLGIAGAAATPLYAQLPPPPASPPPVTRFEYDAAGRRTLVAVPTPAGEIATQSNTFDARGRLTARRDGAGGLTQLGYNPRGDLTQVTDPLQLATRYSRDGFGLALDDISPDAGTTSRSFDNAGRLLTSTDARGVVSTYRYDAIGRLVQLDHAGGGAAAAGYRWTYDETDAGTSFGVGRLTTAQYPAGTTRYAYDALGRVVREQRTLAADAASGTPAFASTTGYTYDAAGRLTSVTYPSGRTVSYAIANGQIVAMSVAGAGGQAAAVVADQIQWEPTGEPRSWRWGMAGQPTHATVRDAYGRVVRQPIGPYTRDISYDARDLIVAFTHRRTTNGQAEPSLDQTFGYDAAGRLTSWSVGSNTYAVTYDANGNRSSFTANGATTWLARQTGTNRMSIGANPLRTFQYDPAGNLSQATPGPRLLHDAAGRLARATQPTLETRLAYDDVGRRIAKYNAMYNFAGGSGLSPTGSAGTSTGNTVYVYDAFDRLMGEYSATTGSPRVEYFWLDEMLLAVSLYSTTGSGASQLFFVHEDHLAAPRAVVDGNGSLRWLWMGDPWGLAPPLTNPSGLGAFTLNLRLPGQYYDAETQLAYNWHRSYDAGNGRYTQSDPIGLAGGINTYAYVSGNPVSYTDPRGLDPVTCSLGGPCDPGDDPRDPDPFPPSAPLSEHDKCMAKCYAKSYVKSIVVVGVLAGAAYAGSAGGLIPPGAVIVGTYVVQKFGRYYTVIKFTYTTKKCLEECKACQ